MTHRLAAIAFLPCLVALGTGCDKTPTPSADVPMQQAGRDKPATPEAKEWEREPKIKAEKDPFAGIQHAVATVQPLGGSKVEGTVRFEEKEGRVFVHVDMKGMDPNSKHGFHVHEYGDCSAADGKSAGGHYNPEDRKHKLPDERTRHAGDMGNLVADEAGTSQHEASYENMTIAGDKSPILGRAVIVHAEPDKGEGEQPSGAAGKRLGCGVIGVANGKEGT